MNPNKTQDKVQMHAVVRGKVQGVGFRAKTSFKAKKLGLTGTVCNLADGSVEIHVQGVRSDIDTLIQELQHAFNNEISSLSVEYSAPRHTYSSFRVI